MKLDKLGLFAGGVLFGTAGLKILGSKDAKKVYTQTTAAALRAKETVLTTVTNIKENADDILADAKERSKLPRIFTARIESSALIFAKHDSVLTEKTKNNILVLASFV